MIENLNGIAETVNYKENTKIRLYLNSKCENYPLHWHTPIEVLMPTKNWYEAEIYDKRIHLNEGDILLICSGCVHTLFAPAQGERIIFQIYPGLFSEMKSIDSVLSMISSYALITKDCHSDIHDDVKQLMLDICEEYYTESRFSEARICSKFLDILSLIGISYANAIDHIDVSADKHQEYNTKFLSMCEYINVHCTEPLNLDEVSCQCGFSKFHFSRLFKQFTGMTFYKYLNMKRIAVAEVMLADPEKSITEVCLNCGFSSMSAFIRMFKIIKGCTPTEFRKLYKA